MKSKRTTNEIVNWYRQNLQKGVFFYVDKLKLGEDILEVELKEFVRRNHIVFDVKEYNNGLLIMLCGLGLAVYFNHNQIDFYIHNADKKNVHLQKIDEIAAKMML